MKKLKNLNTLDRYVVFSVLVLIIFTITQVKVFITTGNEMPVLTRCFFMAFGGEVFACAWIKKLKLQKEYKQAKESESISEVIEEEELG